ncbi:TPA: hypothetical protein ACNGZP_004871, partial [Escherichia coli]
ELYEDDYNLMYLSFSLASTKKVTSRLLIKIVCKFAMISYHYYLKKPMTEYSNHPANNLLDDC